MAVSRCLRKKTNKPKVFPYTLTALPLCNYFWLREVSESFVLGYLAFIREFLYLVHVQSPLPLALHATAAFFQSALKIRLLFLILNLALTSFLALSFSTGRDD